VNNAAGQNVTFYDDGGPSGAYSNSANSIMILNNSGTSTITLSGTFDVEPSFDYIRVYAGVGTGGTLLATYNSTGGTITTPVVSAPGQALTVAFTSDASVAYTGFALTATYSRSNGWYTVPTLGTSLSSASSYTTPVLTGATTYYVQTSDPSSICPTLRAVVPITINPIAAPTVSGITGICPGTSASLTASGLAGASFSWYSDSTATTLVGSTAAFTTPTLSVLGTYSYWVRQSTTAGACVSALTRVDVVVNVPAAPSVSGTTAVCPGTTTTLSATGLAGATFNWYTSSTGGTSFFTGASYTTPAITAATSYYVEQTVTGCGTSLTRTPVNITILPQPPAPTVTGATTVTCGATTTLTISGTTPTTTTLPLSGTVNNPAGQNVTFYDDGGPSGAYSNSANSIMILNNSGSSTITLNGTFDVEPSFDYILVYAGIGTGGTLLATYNSTGGTITTPVVSAPGQALTVAFTSDASVTYTGFALTATYSRTNGWYTTPTGGISLSSAGTYTTAPITAATTYYVETSDPAYTCMSARASVPIAINPIAAPVIAGPTSGCPGYTVTLTATGPSGSTINWYSDPSLTTLIGSGASLVTPTLVTGTNTFYAQASSSAGACLSSSTSYVVNGAVPPNPVVAGDSVCPSSSTTLNATGTSGTVEWYTTSSGGSPFFTGASYTTPALTSAVTYYVQQTVTGCGTSARTAVSVSIKAAPAGPTVTGTSVVTCGALDTLRMDPVSTGSGSHIVPSTGSYTNPAGNDLTIFDEGAGGTYNNNDNGYLVLANAGTNVITLNGTYSTIETCCDHLIIYAVLVPGAPY
jgi:hypothetical protein